MAPASSAVRFSGYTNASLKGSSEQIGGEKRPVAESTHQQQQQQQQQHVRAKGRRQIADFEEGEEVTGRVKTVTEYGIFVDIGAVKDALLPFRRGGSNYDPVVGQWLDDLLMTRVDTELARLTLARQDSSLQVSETGEVYFSTEGRGRTQLLKPVDGSLAAGTPLEAFQKLQTVSGSVRSVTDFGIFVDFGAATSGLLPWAHVPEEVETPEIGDRIEELCIVSLDVARQRVSLAVQEEGSDGELRPFKRTTRGSDPKTTRPLDALRLDEVVDGVVRNVTEFGVFVDVGVGVNGLLHMSHLAAGVEYKKGDQVKQLYVRSIDLQKAKFDLAFLQEDSDGRLRPPARRDGGKALALWSPDSNKSLALRGKLRLLDEVQVSEIVRGRVTSLNQYGAAIDFGCTVEGLLPRCEIDFPLHVGDLIVTLRVVRIKDDHPRVIFDLDDDLIFDDAEMEDDEDPSAYSADDFHAEGRSRALPASTAAKRRIKSFPEPGDFQSEFRSRASPASPAGRRRVFPGPDLRMFPEPDEIPRLSRGELRGERLELPRPSNRFTNRRRQREVQPGGDEKGIEALLEELRQSQAPTAESGGASSSQSSPRGHAEVSGVAEGSSLRPPAATTTAPATAATATPRTPPITTAATTAATATATTAPGPEKRAARGPGSGSAEIERLLQRIAAGHCQAQQLAKAVSESAKPVQCLASASAALRLLLRESRSIVPALTALLELNESLGRVSEALLIRNIPALLELYGNRQREVQVAAEDAAETLVAKLNPYGVEAVLPFVLGALRQKEKTEVKIGALRLLALMRDEDTIRPLARHLDKILPHIAEMLNDVKKDVCEAARDTAKVLFECAQNKDLDPYLETIISALMDQDAIPACVNQLSEIVFVQTVETQALSIVMPLIIRGLKDRDERTKRRALIIADNMCKLVPDVTEMQPFLPSLMPLVRKLMEHISDPEVRSVATRCLATLEVADKADRRHFISTKSVMRMLQEKIPEEKLQGLGSSDLPKVVEYVALLCASMSACRSFEYAEWWHCIMPYLSPHFLTIEECEDLVPDLLESCYDAAEGDDVEDSDEEGEDLCNCVFTLGYGASTLLNNTRLHLKRGKCYGLCGPNDCGKSTLLRAINNEQVDGFPPKSELVTAFVEHGIGEKEPECEWTPLEYIFADETIQAMQIPKKKVVAAMRSLGFDNLKLKSEIGHLSGGWKMKLGLVRAMLMCADILLLDEPTGHLDVANVAWLAEYILGLGKDSTRPVTTIVVSHDTGFLDKVCTNVINVKQRKLKTFRGNVTDFVRRCPEAKSYLTLTDERQRFVLPEPGMLEGVKSKGKKLLKMHNVTYTYPANDTPTLFDVSIEVSLLSRVAVIGPNGAGKSTMIKALVGELPVSGRATVWKHPNVRISYVAQHAFHHVEDHLDKTPIQYFLWRFAGGEDREALNFKAEDVNLVKKPYWLNDGVLGRCKDDKEKQKAVEPELILNRRKARIKMSIGEAKYEYQVKWRFSSAENAMWVPREVVVEMGHLRMVQREDEKQAAAHGLVSRPLTQPQIEEHLAGFGLDASFASHTRIGVLSGGQKVKVVLGASMWLSPHILILDEPTNYLDRDSLGALAAGLKEFGGGVIVISHNREFCHAVCDERWVMDAGHLMREGELDKADVKLDIAAKPDEYIDEFGNVHKFDHKKAATEKELKRLKKQKDLARKRGVLQEEDEDEWWDKLQQATHASSAQAAAPETGAAGG